jgi:hypothetical protein
VDIDIGSHLLPMQHHQDSHLIGVTTKQALGIFQRGVVGCRKVSEEDQEREINMNFFGET